MEQLLSLFLKPDADYTRLLALLVNEIRPAAAHDCESARRNLQALCYILGTDGERRSALRNALAMLVGTHRHAELYTVTGILPNSGFVAEGFRRLGHTLLPEVLDP